MACIDGLQRLYMYRPHFPRHTRAGCPFGENFVLYQYWYYKLPVLVLHVGTTCTTTTYYYNYYYYYYYYYGFSYYKRKVLWPVLIACNFCTWTDRIFLDHAYSRVPTYTSTRYVDSYCYCYVLRTVLPTKVPTTYPVTRVTSS